jgi:CRISPR-associated protein Cas1
MKRHGNTLYVTTQGAYLAKDGTNVVVRVEKETRLSVPVHTLDGIVCFGNVRCSPFLMGLCGKEGVSLSFCTEQGRFLARVLGPQSGHVLLRRAQHVKTASPEAAANFARCLVAAKIANSRRVLQRATRDHGETVPVEPLEEAGKRMAAILARLEQPAPLEEVRGLEGEAANLYFGVFGHLITGDKESFFFRERSRRPPKDNMNALLSFIYALLTGDARSACEGVGLDPQMGFLHADRSGRPSLALDLMEELRPVIADRLALSLVNRRQVSAEGFNVQEGGGVEMDDKTRKAVLVAYQKRKEEEITHPFIEETVTVGLLPHVQARLLARWLRGDLDAYPPFFWK